MPTITVAKPKPIRIAPKVVDLTGLELAFNWMQYNPTEGLEMATEWYAVNTPKLIFGKPLTTDQQRWFGRALKSAKLGEHVATGSQTGTTEGERNTALSTAVTFYERTWTVTPRRADNKGKANRTAETLRAILETLNGAFNSLGLTYGPTMNVERSFSPQAEGYEVRMPMALLMGMAGRSALEIAMDEIPTATQILSVDYNDEVRDGDTIKVPVLNGERFMQNLPKVLKAVYSQYGAITAGSTRLTSVGNVNKVKTVTIGAPSRARLWTDSSVIRVLKAGNPFGGQQGIKYALIRDGMTVGEFKRLRAALGDAAPGRGAGAVKAGVEKGYLEVV